MFSFAISILYFRIEIIAGKLNLQCKIFQITGETVGEVRAVSGMHQRKAEMARQADAFIALPGFFFYSNYLHFLFVPKSKLF